MIASYLLYADGVSHSLMKMSARHLNHQPIAYNELCGSGKDAVLFADVPLQKATPYAAEDADLTRRLYVLLEPELKEALDILYHEIEIPLANVLANMEQAGIRLDAERLAKLRKYLWCN